MSYSSNLYRLQQIDTQLDQARNRVIEIDIKLNQNDELVQAQSAFEAARLRFNEEQNLFLCAEEAVNNLKVKIEQTEAKLYSGKIQNPKELQDLQHESAALKRHLVTLEDRELEALFSLEEAEQQQIEAEHQLRKVQSSLDTQYALLSGEKHTILGQIDHLETDRQVVVNMINPENLATYEQLRKVRRGIAVARAVDNSCAACGSALTLALIQSALTSQNLVRCPTCSRIIYPG